MTLFVPKPDFEKKKEFRIKNFLFPSKKKMSPNSAALIALIVAILVFLACYYYGNLTAMASLAIAAIVGIILQGILIGSILGNLQGLTASEIAARMGGIGFYALMSLIYVLIILIVLIIYAVRDKRVVMV